MEPETHELVEYVRSSKVSLKGKLGIGIMKEIASVSASGKESLELKSDFGLVNKNEVPIESLCSALEVCQISPCKTRWTFFVMRGNGNTANTSLPSLHSFIHAALCVSYVSKG